MEAAQALRRLAVALDGAAAERARAGAAALATWSGPYATTFADELRRCVREAADLAAACRRAAAALESPPAP